MLSAELERAARATLQSLGATREDVMRLAATLDESSVPTVNEFRPEVEGIVPAPSRRVYLAGFDRLEASVGDRRLDEVSLLDLERITNEVLVAAQANPRSVHGHGAAEHFVNATRYFFNAAVRARLLPASPAIGLKRPRRPTSPRRALTERELAELFDAVIHNSDDPELDELILAFARETACRKEGLLNLRLADLNRSHESVVLDEKYGNAREVPISSALIDALTSHAASRHPGCPRAFHYSNGTCLTSRRIDTVVARARRHLPWMRSLRVSFHWLRHTTLSDVSIVAGERVAQAYAGHSDDAHGVTGVYTKPPFEMLAAAHAAIFRLQRSSATDHNSHPSDAPPRLQLAG